MAARFPGLLALARGLQPDPALLARRPDTWGPGWEPCDRYPVGLKVVWEEERAALVAALGAHDLPLLARLEAGAWDRQVRRLACAGRKPPSTVRAWWRADHLLALPPIHAQDTASCALP